MIVWILAGCLVVAIVAAAVLWIVLWRTRERAAQTDTIVAPPSTHSAAANVALSQLGTPYVWAGAAPGGFDCSGLVMWAFGQVGVALPHSSYAQYGYGVPDGELALAQRRTRHHWVEPRTGD